MDALAVSRVLKVGRPRAFDQAQMRRTVAERSYRGFGPMRLDGSPFVTNHLSCFPITIELLEPWRLHGVVYTADFGFRLMVGTEEAGSWKLKVFENPPAFWPESGAPAYLHGLDFQMRPRFCRYRTSGNWFAVAFRRAVHEHYLAPTYPGWPLSSNTTNKAMNRVFAAAHGIEHLVQHEEGSWQAFTFLDRMS